MSVGVSAGRSRQRAPQGRSAALILSARRASADLLAFALLNRAVLPSSHGGTISRLFGVLEDTRTMDEISSCELEIISLH